MKRTPTERYIQLSVHEGLSNAEVASVFRQELTDDELATAEVASLVGLSNLPVEIVKRMRLG